MKKLLRYTLILAVLGSTALFLYLNSLLAKRSGTVQLSPLKSKVSVYYDKWSIPHIEASSEEDGFYALGYVHAQDRLFQMDILRRLAQGELASVLGPKPFLKFDKFFRALNIKNIAKQAARELSSNRSSSRALERYIEGINSFIEKNALPVEYKILGLPAKPFKPHDAIAISGFMAFSFAQSFKIDPLLHYIKSHLGEDHYQDFVLSFNFARTAQVNTGKEQLRKFSENLLAEAPSPLNQIITTFPLLSGSNAWVVGGERTQSGFPILANDPHIKFAAPSVWYESHLKMPNLELYGHYIAGIPVPPLGHTPEKAWGVTMFQNDDIFFYKEKLNPKNKNQIMYKNKWTPLTLRKEEIYVKGKKDPIILEVKDSPHGPIINEVIDEFKEVKEPVAMWWAFANPKNDMLSAFYHLAFEKNFKKIPQHLAKIHAPGLNILYADHSNNIAWWAVAKIPKLDESVNTLEFLDGSLDSHQIESFLPFSKNPQLINPKQRFIVSANSDPFTVTKDKKRIPGYYCNDQRHNRIQELLTKTKKKWTLEDMKSVQLDGKDSINFLVVGALNKALKTGKAKDHKNLSTAAEKILSEWTGTHELEEVAPTIYYSFLSQLVNLIFKDKLRKDLYFNFLGSHHLYNVIEDLMKKPDSVWWHPSKENSGRDVILRQAWEKTLVSLDNFLGDKPKSWLWKKAHTIEQEHLIGKKKPLHMIFNIGPAPIAGGYEVVNNQRFRLSPKLPFKVTSGPSTRRLIDLKDTKESLGINPTGQSGYFFDKHYKDQFELYRKGQYRKQIMNMEKIKKESKNILTLTPSN